MKASERTKVILRAIGYTPTALASAIGVDISQAKRILREGGSIYADELLEIARATGIHPNILCGTWTPGNDNA